MTEKQYGGDTGMSKGKAVAKSNTPIGKSFNAEKSKIDEDTNEMISKEEIQDYKKAGEIAKQVKQFARALIKPNMKLLEIAEKIESKIVELGGEIAFPVNLGINDIAAHYTPSYDDSTLATGLLKVDIGIHVNGCIADTAFSLDLENSEENKKLIEASEKALEAAKKTLKSGVSLGEIGKAIQDAIAKYKFSPIRNLCGHELAQFHVHAGLTIPNYDNGNETEIEPGAYAIEPFTTPGEGVVYDSKPSGIYNLIGRKAIRDPLAREIINFIEEEYETLPFCSRWIFKKFGQRCFRSLTLLEQSGILHQYDTLVEKSHSKVAQSEDTVIVTDKVEVTSS